MPDDAPEPPPPTVFDEANAGELFARATPPAKMPGSTGSGRRWVPPTVEELQRGLPQYEVIELLGLGGMGAVYKGVQRSLDRFVAIEILPPGIEESDVHYAKRFKIEARAMARLDHPGIVAVHDAGETAASAGSGQASGLLYFVMDYVEGTDVQKLIAQGPLPQAARRAAPEGASNANPRFPSQSECTPDGVPESSMPVSAAPSGADAMG